MHTTCQRAPTGPPLLKTLVTSHGPFPEPTSTTFHPSPPQVLPLFYTKAYKKHAKLLFPRVSGEPSEPPKHRLHPCMPLATAWPLLQVLCSSPQVTFPPSCRLHNLAPLQSTTRCPSLLACRTRAGLVRHAFVAGLTATFSKYAANKAEHCSPLGPHLRYPETHQCLDWCYAAAAFCLLHSTFPSHPRVIPSAPHRAASRRQPPSHDGYPISDLHSTHAQRRGQWRPCGGLWRRRRAQASGRVCVSGPAGLLPCLLIYDGASAAEVKMEGAAAAADSMLS